jgi:hypothetical protein
MSRYEIFHRTWWRWNPAWPDGREPGVGIAQHIGWACSEDEAREMCTQWNAANPPGLFSDRAEYSLGKFT